MQTYTYQYWIENTAGLKEKSRRKSIDVVTGVFINKTRAGD